MIGLLYGTIGIYTINIARQMSMRELYACISEWVYKEGNIMLIYFTMNQFIFTDSSLLFNRYISLRLAKHNSRDPDHESTRIWYT